MKRWGKTVWCFVLFWQNEIPEPGHEPNCEPAWFVVFFWFAVWLMPPLLTPHKCILKRAREQADTIIFSPKLYGPATTFVQGVANHTMRLSFTVQADPRKMVWLKTETWIVATVDQSRAWITPWPDLPSTVSTPSGCCIFCWPSTKPFIPKRSARCL